MFAERICSNMKMEFLDKEIYYRNPAKEKEKLDDL